MLLLSVSAVKATPTDTHAIFRLTLAGPVPNDAAFNLHLDTVPASAGQTGFNFCALSDYTRPCLSGKTYMYGVGGFEVGTVLAFRFERWNGERNEPIYSGRVTLTRADPDHTFTVTYDYSLGLPNTAVSPTQSGPLIWLVPGALLASVPFVVLVRRRRMR
jgi:hypothetical protein